MNYKFVFSTFEEKEKIKKDNSHLYLIEEVYLIKEKYLIFTDEKPPCEDIEIPLSEINANKISILTEENENLKQELALTQDAVNEILFMMMNMEVK